MEKKNIIKRGAPCTLIFFSWFFNFTLKNGAIQSTIMNNG
jgi:hypothetical protein